MSVLPTQWRSQALAWPPLIGREQDIEAIEHCLQHQRLVTLWGPGGSGKTRLAMQIAQSLPDHFADGVRLISCADLHDPELITLEVATSLGIHGQDERILLESIIERLCPLHLLLIIDNGEHLLDACTTLVDRVLAACPRIQVLITSRELLNLPYEQAVQVQPLALPPAGTLPPVDELSRYGAIELFVQRAQMAQPDFALTGENASLIVTICRLVDGLPLAIELAAARVRMLALEQLAEQLAHGNAPLRGGQRLAPARHLTLQATIMWSYQLLTCEEQQLFRRLALGMGSFDLSLAEALCEGIGGDAVDLLGRLIDKSLVTVVTREGGSARYRLLDTIRHFAREQVLEGDETESTFQRYRAWMQRLVEQAEAELQGPQQIGWVDRLEAEIEQIRSIMAWLVHEGYTPDLVQFSAALLPFYERRAHVREAKQWLEAALTQGRVGDPIVEAKALYTLGVLSIRLHKFEQAQEYLTQAWERYTDLEDQMGVASALSRLGYIHYWKAEYDAAKTCFEKSMQIVPNTAHSIKAETFLRFAMTLHALGEPQQAHLFYRKCLALYRQTEDVGGIALTLANLGSLLTDEGEYAQAQTYLLESLHYSASLGDRNKYLLALVNLYDTAMALKDLTLTQEYLAAALSSTWEEYDTWLLGLLFERLAQIALLQHRAVQAAQLFGYTATLKHEQADQLPDAIRMQLHQVVEGENAALASYDAAWQVGQRMGSEEAFSFALQGNQSLIDEQVDAGTTVETCTTSSIVSSTVAPLWIEALGGGSASRDSRQASITWHYAKARELLFYLLDFPQRTKGQICLALWPDAASEQASTYMRVALYHLRKTLGDASWVLFTNSSYAFNRSLPYWYDVEQFETQIAQVQALEQDAQDTDERATQLLGKACALYRGNYLAGLPPQEWILLRQAELQRNYLEAEYRLAVAYQRVGDIQQALAHLQRVTAGDPYHERAHHGIIQCYAQLGQRSQAIHYYQELKRYLRDELGVAPDPHITTFITTLLEHASRA
jgi:predicted ATPase/two-component SAPR family response regulator